MSQVMSWVGLVVLLKVWDGEGHIQVPDVFNRNHLVELLWGGNKESPSDVFATRHQSESSDEERGSRCQPGPDWKLTLSCSSWKGCSGNSGTGTFLFSTSPNSCTTMDVSSSNDSAGRPANDWLNNSRWPPRTPEDSNPHLVPTHTVPSGWRSSKWNGTGGAPGGHRRPRWTAGSRGSVYYLQDGVVSHVRRRSHVQRHGQAKKAQLQRRPWVGLGLAQEPLKTSIQILHKVKGGALVHVDPAAFV